MRCEHQLPSTLRLLKRSVRTRQKESKQRLATVSPGPPVILTLRTNLLGDGCVQVKKALPSNDEVLYQSQQCALCTRLTGLGEEAVTFDRSDHPEQHKIRVTDESGKEVSHEDFLNALQAANRNAPMRLWIPSDKVGPRANGLFVYDIAIDLRTLFSVSINTFEPEVTQDMISQLKSNGWIESPDGIRLICPKARREQIAPALANSLIYWRITSNQSRTYSPQNTLAVAISHNANRLGAAIRADLTEESEYKRAAPVVDDSIADVDVYVALTAKAYIREVTTTKDALEQAEKDLTAQILEFDYDA